jgi:hypothetical protein
MKNKIFIILVLILLISVVFVSADLNKKFKNNLKKALFDELKKPKNKNLTLEETKDLLEFYLADYDLNNIDWSQIPGGQNSNQDIASLISRLFIVYTKDKTPDQSICNPGWKCKTDFHKAYQNSDCGWENEVFCEYGCEDGACIQGGFNSVWDVDDNGAVQENDGTLTIRYLFGFSGDELTQESVGKNAKRSRPSEIKFYLGCIKGLKVLDADRNGKSDALTDGILIQRYIMGYSGQDLINDAIGKGATRTTPEAIIAFLSNPDSWYEGACPTPACFTSEDCSQIDGIYYCSGDESCITTSEPGCMNAGTVNAYCGKNETTNCAVCENGCDAQTNKCIKTGCGNNVREADEVCDGTDLAGESCQNLGYDSGSLFCTYNCSGFDVLDCVINPTCDSCSDCDTIFTSCTYQECKQDCGAGCYYRGSVPLIEDCIDLDAACSEIMSCKDYSADECTSNPCGLSPGCTLSGSDCVVSTVESVRFGVIGCYGTGYPDAGQVASLVKSWNPDFIITTGDNNYQEGAALTIDKNVGQWYSDYIYPYYGSYGSTATVNAFFPTLGNHDWIATDAQPYLDYFTLPGNERYYDFVKGPVHFFAIDSDTNEPDGATSTSIQGQWLKNKLAESTSPFKVVYFHHSPYGPSKGELTRMQWPFKEWGADIVLTAHDHLYERLIIDGFPYIVNGLGGAMIYDFNYNFPGSQYKYNGDLGAMLVEATSDSMVFKFFKRTGELLDSYTLGTTPAGPCDSISTCSDYTVAECAANACGLSPGCVVSGNDCVEDTSTPSTAVTFQQLKEDNTVVHEMSPLPIIPEYWGWALHGWPWQEDCGPRNMPDDGSDRHNPWGQLLPDPSTPTNLNAGIELGPMVFYVQFKSTGEWKTYEHGLPNGGYVFVSGDNLPEAPNTAYNPIPGPGGGLFHKMGMGNWVQNQGTHWWPGHEHEYLKNSDIKHLAVSVTARVVLEDPDGPDDRDQARYLIGIGMDRRAADGCCNTGGTLMSRHRYVTNEWQTFTMHDICPDMVEIERPPIFGRTWDT